MIIGHKSLLIEVLPLIDLYEVYSSHKRLQVFVHKGRECVACGREGVLLLKTQGNDSRIHIDLYTEDFVLMTVDHIIPKAQARKIGWSRRTIERLTNKQPMCDPCNNRKGCKMITPEEQRQQSKELPQNRTGTELLRQFVHNNNIFDRKLPESIAFS